MVEFQVLVNKLAALGLSDSLFMAADGLDYVEWYGTVGMSQAGGAESPKHAMSELTLSSGQFIANFEDLKRVLRMPYLKNVLILLLRKPAGYVRVYLYIENEGDSLDRYELLHGVVPTEELETMYAGNELLVEPSQLVPRIKQRLADGYEPVKLTRIEQLLAVLGTIFGGQ